MKVNKYLLTYAVFFFIFIFFNSPKCYEYLRFNSYKNSQNYFLKSNSNYFNDIKFYRPNEYQSVFLFKKESIKLFTKCE